MSVGPATLLALFRLLDQGLGRWRRPCPESREASALHQPLQVLEGEDLPPGGEKELFHVLAADAETSTADARDYLELVSPARLVLPGEFSQVLHAVHLFAGRAIVLCDLRLDDDTRTKLVRHKEVRGLVESGDSFSSL